MGLSGYQCELLRELNRHCHSRDVCVLPVQLVLYGFQAGILIYVHLKMESSDPRLLVVSLSVAIFDNCVCGVGFLVFGLWLYCSHNGDSLVAGVKTQIRSTLIVALFMTVCFVARSVLYIMQVFSSNMDIRHLLYMDNTARLILICMSEITPIVYQLYLQRARKKQEQHHESFINSLYEESDDGTAIESDPLLLSESQPTLN